MREWLVCVALAMGGCATQMPVLEVPTPAVIAAVRGPMIQICHVALNWDRPTVARECGPPAFELSRASGGTCLIYPTLSTTFAGTSDAKAVAVCLAMHDKTVVIPGAGFGERDKAPERAELVDEVRALRELPPKP